MDERQEIENDTYSFIRLTCALIGFSAFFLITFFTLYIADETGEYYVYTVIFGLAMLAATTMFFCCIINEVKRIESTTPQPNEELSREQGFLLQPRRQPEPELSLPEQPEPELPLPEQPEPELSQPELSLPEQPQQELSLPEKPGPDFSLHGQPEAELRFPSQSGPVFHQSKRESYLYDKNIQDSSYARQIRGISSMDSNENSSSKNDSDFYSLELQKMAKSGLYIPVDPKEAMAGTGKDFQHKYTRCEAVDDFQLDSTKAGPSKMAGENSVTIEFNDVPLKAMSNLSLDGFSKDITASEKQAEVSNALSRLSLDRYEK